MLTLNKDNYRDLASERHYLSVSQFKGFTQCETAALAKLKGEYQGQDKKALALGQYLHAWNEGVLDDYIEANKAQVFRKTGDRGKCAMYVKADTAIAALEAEPLIMKALDGDKEVILTGTIDGVPWKCCVDSLGSARFADLKYIKDFASIYDPEKGRRVSWIEYWGYNMQMAIYQELIRQSTGNLLEPLIVAITKEAPPNKGIFGGFEQGEMHEAIRFVEYTQQRIVELKSGRTEPAPCGACEYCRSKSNVMYVQKWNEIN